jgi:hypothetical protein
MMWALMTSPPAWRCGCGTGVDGGLDGGDITGDDGVAHRVADLFHRTREFDVCGFEHRVYADDEAGEAAGFEESYCLFGHGSYWLLVEWYEVDSGDFAEDLAGEHEFLVGGDDENAGG